MRVLIVGRRSTFARYLLNGVEKTHIDLARDIDITRPEQMLGLTGDYDYVVNCAAITDVNLVENQDRRAFQVNAVGPASVGLLARRLGAHYVHISSDYVFSGAGGPYHVDDKPFPIQKYGYSKWAGELGVKAVMGNDPYTIVRMGWLYGALYPNCAPMLALGPDRKKPVYLWGKIRGIPTHARAAAGSLLVSMVTGDIRANRITHIAPGMEPTTWFDFLEPYCNAEEIEPPARPKRPRVGGLVPSTPFEVPAGLEGFRDELSQVGKRE